MSEYVEHPGIVKAIINPNTVLVSIVSTSACASCHSKAACTMGLSEIKEKEVEVNANADEYPIGTKVIVRMPLSSAGLAVLYSYVVPLILVIVVIVILNNIYENELLAGAIGLITLLPYYLLLSLFKEKLKSKFNFQIRKCIETT